MDDIVITQEVFHSMRIKKGKKGFFVVKVDLEKAYDQLRWEFLDDTLRQVGLGHCMLTLIMKCVSSALMKILLNGAKM